MSDKNILIVAVDGLRTAALGAYGNTSYPTPALDQFASESFLLDACFAATPELALIYRAMWQSLDPLRSEETTTSAKASLPVLFRERGYATWLITNDASMARFPDVAEFDECMQISESRPERAANIEQTSIFQLLSIGGEVFDRRCEKPCLLWIHANGMYGPWDAPLELQNMLLDEGDPPPIDSVDSPNACLNEDDDPDSAFRFACAYGAQVMALDAAWGDLTRVMDRLDRDKWLMMLLGVRGFPLGEHRRIGGIDDRLYADQLHVPWLIRFPAGEGRLSRCGSLTSHVDLVPTLLDWHDSAAAARQPLTNERDGRSIISQLDSPWTRTRDTLLASSASGGLAILTEDWSLIDTHRAPILGDSSPRPESDEPELYVRPDDRWEANNVASLCPLIVEDLCRTAHQVADGLRGGEARSQLRIGDALPSNGDQNGDAEC